VLQPRTPRRSKSVGGKKEGERVDARVEGEKAPMGISDTMNTERRRRTAGTRERVKGRGTSVRSILNEKKNN